MGQTTGQRQNKYRSKLRRRILGWFAFRCCSCYSIEKLEFAHRSQSFWGNGRGKTSRLVDIYSYPELYILLCHTCHTAYDLSNTRSNKKSESKEEYIEKVKANIEKVRLEYSKDIRGDIKIYYENVNKVLKYELNKRE